MNGRNFQIPIFSQLFCIILFLFTKYVLIWYGCTFITKNVYYLKCHSWQFRLLCSRFWLPTECYVISKINHVVNLYEYVKNNHWDFSSWNSMEENVFSDGSTILICLIDLHINMYIYFKRAMLMNIEVSFYQKLL